MTASKWVFADTDPPRLADVPIPIWTVPFTPLSFQHLPRGLGAGRIQAAATGSERAWEDAAGGQGQEGPHGTGGFRRVTVVDLARLMS